TNPNQPVNVYYFAKQQQVYYPIIMIKDQEIIPITIKNSKILTLLAEHLLGKTSQKQTGDIAVTNKNGKIIGSVDMKGVYNPTTSMPSQPKHIIKSFLSKDFNKLVSADATIKSIKHISHFLANPNGKVFAALNQQTNKYHFFPETHLKTNIKIIK